jgi:isoleucyl-tRNA synthetase
MDYKNTINLLETNFPMRGDLAKREPLMLEKWITQDRYQKIRQKAKGRKKFILHDGPPYANGQLHIGHASNKILKDIIIRSKTLAGYDAPFTPGWDCHGLPIELNIEKKYGKNLSPKEFRDKCRSYADEQINLQKLDFIRLGVLGDWNNPYKTMNFSSEANIVRALGEVYKNGFMFRGFKPVHWCIECGSALAEAEVEYQEKVSPAIYVKFSLANNINQNLIKGYLQDKKNEIINQLYQINSNSNLVEINPQFKNTAAIIWTTTPWTLPANQAICLGKEISYSLVKVADEYLIIATDLVASVMNAISATPENFSIIANQLGENLGGALFVHPFLTKEVPLIMGEHVTCDAGTGLVHTAPAHGVEDFKVGMEYNLEIANPVGDDGKFISSTLFFAGITVWQANSAIIEVLKNNAKLFHASKLNHSYPHCWRHKTPLIFRTTSQWFISMDKVGNKVDKTLRELALGAVGQTKFFPEWGNARLESMIKNRPDWCISRQRSWGVPMTFFVHKETQELHPDSYMILQQVAQKIEQEGIDAWFDENLTAASLNIANANEYKKLSDTLDVWFDSGTTHFSVLKQRQELSFPADLYLEGSDQHRGWFQSSLLTSCAINAQAPYKQLLTHGFLVDGQGYKMSKSKGNIISIPDGVKRFGADILRLWAASIDYSGDIAFSEEIMKQITESYRRIRNTLRFLLANLVDFNYDKDALAIDKLVEVDQYALIKLNQLQQNIVTQLYTSYQFHSIVQELVIYCSEDLGGFYLDILKDRLYTAKTDSPARRSAQTAIYHLAKSLILMLSPILCFTADEAWAELMHDDEESTMYHLFHEVPIIAQEQEIITRWNKVSEIRKIVLKELENSRVNGVIGSSLQAEIVIHANKETIDYLKQLKQDLKFAYMVSSVTLQESDTIKVDVISSAKPKCERCWHYSATVGTNNEHATICDRCIDNLFKNGEIRQFA